MTTRTAVWAAAGVVALAAVALLNLLQGSGDLPQMAVLRALFAPDDSLETAQVHDLRLPRVAAGLIAGMALAGATVLLQAVTRNPLAEPATLGLSAGGALAVTLAAAMGGGVAAGAPTIAVAAIGVAVAALIVGAVAAGRWGDGVRLILAGMALSLAFAAGTALVQLLREVETSALFLWGGGSLMQLGWDPVQAGALIGAPTLVAAFALTRSLDVLGLGEETARALGSRTTRVRVSAVVLAALLTAVAVGVAGPIAFLGILSVGIARIARANGHLATLLVALPWGAALLLGADVLGRALLGVEMETPAGLICALIGAPALIVVARRLGDTHRGELVGGVGRMRRRPLALVAVAAALPLLTVAALSFGDGNIAPAQLWSAIVGEGDIVAEFALEERAPRLLLALLAGACLAGAGTVLQAAVRNPFAGPELVGVTAGASIGALTVLLLVPTATAAALAPAAFVGGGLAMVGVLLLSWSRRSSPQALALIGLAVTAAGSAVVALMILHHAPTASVAITWLAGSTYAATWGDVQLLALAALVLVPAAFALLRRLDLLLLDDELGQALGMRVGATRALALAVGAALAAAAVSVVGAVAFVGLLAPHAARMVAGAEHRRLLPTAMVMGALLLGAADMAGRSIAPPTEIPSGLIVALIGAPYLGVLMWRTRPAS